MSKTIKKCYLEKLTFDHLLKAYLRVKKGKSLKKELIVYEMSLENNLNNLLYTLKEEKYHPAPYREFTIYEPKMRLIKSLPIKDRIVHQWYIEEFIKPYIVKRFIKDTYACLENRGTHKAAYQVKRYMRIKRYERKNYYILKCDIKKYFYSIDKNILFKLMQKYIKDQKLLNLTKNIIFDEESLKGIPIGNYTSQYFANIYLNELDQFIKQDLKLKYYVRYMDDFIILVDTKKEAQVLLEKIRSFLKEHLELELNSKSRYYPNHQGVNFCGYVIFEDYLLIRKRSKKDINKKIKTWNMAYLNSSLNEDYVRSSINSWLAHISHADTYRLRRKYLQKMLFIEKEEES